MASRKHKRIKKNIGEYFKFFDDNFRRYKRSMRFAYKETLDSDAREALQLIGKPPVEINYIQPFLSRILGEYSSQTPGVVVTGNGAAENINVDMISLIEGHMLSILDDFRDSGTNRGVLKEQCGGGFSVLKVDTKYRSSKTFEQFIVLKKAKDPVMCFFDPMAKLPCKSDGKYCGEMYPMLVKDFKKKYPAFAEEADSMKYNVFEDSPFSWSYKNMRQNILLLSDYYCIENKKYTLLRLADGQEMSEKDYNKMKKEWSELEPIPDIAERRVTESRKVKRYVLFGKDILTEETTSLPGLPYIFVDGDSAFVYKDDESGEIEQVVHSYIYNAMDAQKLLNFTAQTIANFSENYMQQKFIIDEKAIVDANAWTSPQKASVLIKRSTDDAGNIIPNPVENVVQQDLPQSVMSTFASMQNVMQNSFGTYDAALGINNNNLSGKAITDGSTQNSMTSTPFKDNYSDAITAAAQLILKMLPSYYVTPMTIPYTNAKGEREFIKINQKLSDGSNDPQSIRMDYDEDDLGVKITSGYSSAIQKDKALKMLASLSDSFPAIKELINSKGVSLVLENLEMHGSDKLMKLANDAQKEAENKPPEPNPMQQQLALKQQEMQMKQQQSQLDMQIKMEELEVQKQKIKADLQIALLRHHQQGQKDSVEEDKIRAQINTHDADNETKIADHLLKRADQHHKHTLDVHKHNHVVRTSQHKAQE